MSPPKSVGGELLGITPYWSVGPNWFWKKSFNLAWFRYNIFLYIILYLWRPNSIWIQLGFDYKTLD